MTTYEVTRGNRVFEIEAGSPEEAGQKADGIVGWQPQQPRNYALSEVPGAYVENFGKSADEMTGAIAKRYGEVGVRGIAGDVFKTGIGTVAKGIRGVGGEIGLGPEAGTPEFDAAAGPYERQADPMLQQMLKDWGWREPTWGAQYEQAKRNVAENPVQATLDASAVLAPAGASVPGRAGRAIATTSRAINPVSWAGRGVTTVAKRAVTPFPAAEGLTESANYLRGLGVRPTAGQATGSRRLKFAESEIGGAATADIIDQQQNAYARVALGDIGENAPRATRQVMDRAYDRIGSDFNRIAARNTLVPDAQLTADITNAVDEYVNLTGPGTRAPIVQQMASDIARRGARGPIYGRTYQSLRSRLARLARGTSDPELGTALHELREALDDAMERSMTAAGRADDVAAWRTARDQYRHFVALERAAVRHAGAAEGTITPGALTTAASTGHRRRGFVTGRGDYSELAHAGQAVLTPMPESGSAARIAAQAVPVAVGAALGAGSGGGIGAVVGGIAGRMLTGRALMSRPVQRYLGNQLIPSRGTTPGGRAAGAVGRVATAVVPRVTSKEVVEQTREVLGKDAYDNLGRDKATRNQLAGWLKAKANGKGMEEAATMLANSIARKVKRPDLADRIARELLESGG